MLHSHAQAETAYHELYRFAAAAAIGVALLTVGEVIAFVLFPPPTTVSDWFALFQRQPLIGLLDFWGLELPMYLLFLLVFLALYLALRPLNPGRMALALSLVLVGSAVFFATNNPFSMLSLSRHYAAASSDTQRVALLAAGETLLALTNQRAVGGFNIALLLVSIAGLLTSSVMLQSQIFGRFVAYLGLLAHGLSLADYLREALTASVLVALLIILPNAMLLLFWFILVGRGLARFATSAVAITHADAAR